MRKVKVNHGIKSYEILISSGILTSFDFGKINASKYVIITDSNVKKLYGESFILSCHAK